MKDGVKNIKAVAYYGTWMVVVIFRTFLGEKSRFSMVTKYRTHARTGGVSVAGVCTKKLHKIVEKKDI